MKKVIIISGTSRSGSSLLDLMIGNSDKGFSSGELYRLFRPIKSTDVVYKNEFNESIYLDKVEKFWDQIKSKGEENVYDNIFDSFERLEYIVDSSKNPIWIRNQLKYSKNKSYKIIPIIIYKIPSEYAYSLYKRNKSKYWKKRWINKHLILFSILEKFITVRYSELAKNPSKHLKLICENIGIDYFDGKENFWINQSKKYFLFGSDTLRKSRKNVYYNYQNNNLYLEFIKKELDKSEKIFTDILQILDAYEVGSKYENRDIILNNKEEIKKFSILTQLKCELETSKFFELNNFVSNLKKNTDKILDKIKY